MSYFRIKKPTDLYFSKEVDLNMIVHIKSVYSSIQFGDFPPDVLTDWSELQWAKGSKCQGVLICEEESVVKTVNHMKMRCHFLGFVIILNQQPYNDVVFPKGRMPWSENQGLSIRITHLTLPQLLSGGVWASKIHVSGLSVCSSFDWQR